jgi:hypothetical protein
MLAALRELPPRGSLRESILILYSMKQEEIAHAKMFVTIQTMLDKEKAAEAFESYKRSAFPWIESIKNKDRASQVAQLMDEVKQGPLSVKPLWQSPIKSRLKQKVAPVPATAEQKKAGDELFKKIGKVVPNGR